MDIILRDSIGGRHAAIDTRGLTFRASSVLPDSRGIGSDSALVTPGVFSQIARVVSAAFTWEFFLKPEALTYGYGLVVGNISGLSGIYLTTDDANPDAPCIVAIDINGDSSNSAAIVLGTLYHVAVVSNGTTLKIYVNAVDTTALGGTYDCTVTGVFNAMFNDNVADALSCDVLDELAYYPLALTGPKVTAHYAARSVSAAAYRALVAADGATNLWSLEEGSELASGTFTGAANGAYVQVLPGFGIDFTLEVGAGETFSGKVQLQRSRNGGQSWEPVPDQTFNGTVVAIDDSAPVDRTIVNDSGGREWYRLVNLTASGADGMDWALTRSAPDVLRPSTRATAAEMGDWLATLPTSDPAVAGEPWLDSGVLTVSAG